LKCFKLVAHADVPMKELDFIVVEAEFYKVLAESETFGQNFDVVVADSEIP